jgi:hypothetical protein
VVDRAASWKGGNEVSGNWAAGFFRSQLSDKDGTVSNTKVLIFLIVNNVLIWISALIALYARYVLKEKTGINMTDIVTFLGAVGTFATLLCGTLAGLKYGSDAINNHAPNATPQVQPPDAAQATSVTTTPKEG